MSCIFSALCNIAILYRQFNVSQATISYKWRKQWLSIRYTILTQFILVKHGYKKYPYFL